MLRVRPALEPPPSDELEKDYRIDFRHPAYPETEQPLLNLAAFDGEKGDGIDYDVAFWACGIVTNNSWAVGWFAIKESGKFKKVDRPADGILRDEVYYYLIGETPPTYKYAVVPSFDHWRFPHNNLPDLWKQAAIPKASRIPGISNNRDIVAFRDGTCRITGYSIPTEVAHLVPVADGHWLSHNRMKKYTSEEPVDDPGNMLLLRRDLHFLFDQRRFTIIPREDLDNHRLVYTLHILAPQKSTELVDLYHNRLLQPLSGISKELLFARFAWSIFQNSNFPFLKGMAQYTVRLFNLVTGETGISELFEKEVRDRATLFPPCTRSRSNSPRKQQRRIDSAVDEEGSTWKRQRLRDDLSEEPEDWPPRGRLRDRSDDCHEHESPTSLARSFSSGKSSSVSSNSVFAAYKRFALGDVSESSLSGHTESNREVSRICEDSRPFKIKRLS